MKKYKVNSIKQLKPFHGSSSIFLDIDSYLKHNVYGIFLQKVNIYCVGVMLTVPTVIRIVIENMINYIHLGKKN